MDFSKFDKEVNKEQLLKDYNEAKENGGTGDYGEVPKGTYLVKIENMEIKATKQKGEPMFSVMCRILEAVDDGDNEKAIKYMERFKKCKTPCIFFNRKIFGNKETDKWNDGKAIATVTGWLDKLDTETIPVFEGYNEFANLVLDIMEEVEEYKLTLEVEYDSEDFNPIKIVEVFED